MIIVTRLASCCLLAPAYKPAARILSSEGAPGVVSPAGILPAAEIPSLRERTRLAAIAATARRLTLRVRI